MRFTILTQYYLPETGAPQNRLHSLARNLVLAGHEVEVLTAIPNYPKMRIFDEYRGKFSHTENIDGIAVRRSWIYVSRGKAMFPRLLNYFSFVLTSLFTGLRMDRSDYLICESPPLFLGISAMGVAKSMGARLIFNVSDLWPETAEKLHIIGDGLMLRAAYRLEEWIYRRSHLVTGQTQGIVRDIAGRFPKVPVFWLPNGIDEDVVADVHSDNTWRKEHGLEGKKVFMYAGILGHAQGLEVIIKAAAHLKDEVDLAFVIVGDGPLSDELQKLNQQLNAGVVFIPSMSKHAVMGMIAEAYSYIIALKKIDLFKGAIPSKILDPLALGVPILLGVEGEAKEIFIDRGQAGLFFEPENAEELIGSIQYISKNTGLRDQMGLNGRTFVKQHFNCRTITANFLQQL